MKRLILAVLGFTAMVAAALSMPNCAQAYDPYSAQGLIDDYREQEATRELERDLDRDAYQGVDRSRQRFRDYEQERANRKLLKSQRGYWN